MYYLVLSLLVFFSCVEMLWGQKNKIWFYVSYFLMTVVATFRYGQMDDYFNYNLNYENPEVYEETDPLFGIIIFSFKFLGFDYTVFVAVISFTCMALSFRFFKDVCNESCLSLLIFYGYTFMLCPMSAIRQGLCLALLLYIYPLLRDKRNYLYYFYVVVGCFIHFSFIIVIFLPILLKYKIYNQTWIWFLFIGFSVLAFIGLSIASLLPFDRIIYYEEGEGNNIWLRMALRILLILPVLLTNPIEESNGYYAKAICLIGYVLYCGLSFNDLVAGRIEYYFRTFLCLFVAEELKKQELSFSIISRLGTLMVLNVFLWFKNVDAGIERMGYREDITAYNFPYISVFNKSDLKKYSSMETYNLEE